MKAKLLKKLRKRFIWKKEDNHDFYTLWDRKLISREYAFVIGMEPCEAVIWRMLKRLGMVHEWESNYKRGETRRLERIKRKIKSEIDTLS